MKPVYNDHLIGYLIYIYVYLIHFILDVIVTDRFHCKQSNYRPITCFNKYGTTALVRITRQEYDNQL